MTRFVLGALAFLAVGWSIKAEAADFNYNSRAPYTVNQPLNAYSWAGPYLGGNFGYAWGSVDNAWAKPSGFVGGLQPGHDLGAVVVEKRAPLSPTDAAPPHHPLPLGDPAESGAQAERVGVRHACEGTRVLPGQRIASWEAEQCYGCYVG